MKILGIVLTAIVIFIVFILDLVEKRKKVDVETVCRTVKRYYESRRYQIFHKTVNGCEVFLIKKGLRKIIICVGGVNFDVVKEILYMAYMNRARDIRVVYSSITKESLEAFERMRRNSKIHKTKVKVNDLRHFESVVF
ncbi:hypothetical protein Mc24_06823 [Thermotoga sp. Mc24]|nr:hypothetical protein [Thermotoga sp. 38H-to]KHC90909.1 hypothetical protein Mc24_06823 [Thermotoga sp. Mc24]